MTMATGRLFTQSTIVAGLTIAVLTALVSLALAKPPKPPTGRKPPPDAEADDAAPTANNATSTADASAQTLASDAGSGPVMIAQQTAGDSGVKLSPLTPAPNEFPSQNLLGDAGASVDYDKLMGDISALRARAAAVGDTLFHSRIALSLEIDGDHAKISRLVVSLDDGAVYTAQPNYRPSDMTAIYTHALAPGRHALTVDLDRRDDRNDAFRTSQRSRFVVDIPRDQELGVELTIDDDSNMGKNFPSDQSGRYDMHVRLKASAHPLKK